MKWYALIKWLTYAGMSVANLNSGGSLWPQSNIYFPIPGKISDKFGVAQFGRNGGSLCSGICILKVVKRLKGLNCNFK